MKIMLSAGEVSGDLHGASIAAAIHELSPETELIGFGGKQMQAAGVRLNADMADYSVMGVWEVILNLRRIMRLLNHLTNVMKEERPDLLVLIDYPDFNWRLAKRAKELGIPVFSYIPPSAWAWRKGRAKSCAALADEFAAIFPFETKVYEDAGANISFVGNPLVDKVRPSMSDEEAKAYFGIKADEYPVLLMPGSRRQEIELLFPAMLEAAKRIKEVKKDTVFYLPVAQSMAQEDMEKMAEKAGVDIRFTHDHTYDLMAQAEFSLATSGTVVLEAALMGLPCIVLYRLSPVSYFFGKLLVHVRFFSLPNILLGEEIQPELLQDEVNPERILKEARRFWEESSYAEGVRKKLREACDRLGPPNAAKRVAERILAAAVRLGADKQTFGGSV
ncbi:lipid-A-disaccharide synthase [Schwartzia succinivorans]|jgi:lipid-A-disaccharide synthase|uniref:Lipid-A-disaccharide synthase n=1 Tax=Schwartzia succinivorans DSM 10502 TaxID=1123243 RepID=A0A1M4SD78_9FIRM|nr:lipid-A-disaccharide synthase [Schwartzia succinivorans]SHE30193.1 lipid-A-disaccharide synthase [Schwartzia succinivorans DSM 10502]